MHIYKSDQKSSWVVVDTGKMWDLQYMHEYITWIHTWTQVGAIFGGLDWINILASWNS